MHWINVDPASGRLVAYYLWVAIYSITYFVRNCLSSEKQIWDVCKERPPVMPHDLRPRCHATNAATHGGTICLMVFLVPIKQPPTGRGGRQITWQIRFLWLIIVQTQP